jgi:NADH-quinone oxidoreductase subunit M
MLIELLLALCLLGAGVVFFLPDRIAPKATLGISLAPVAASLYMYAVFDGTGNALIPGSGTIAFESMVEWITVGPYALNWHVGLDGVSMPLVLLSTVLVPLAILASWTPIDERESQFYGLVLLMEAALIGVFAALDFFVWFVFWEGVLIPMYFLIGIWGGARRGYAAIKFFIYTNVASLLMFIGFFGLVFGLGDSITTLDMPAIAAALRAGELSALGPIQPGALAVLAFFAMFVGFGVKVPIVPFHTWLPDAHVEAPTPISVLLAGVLLKMGTYALLRFNFTMLPGVAQDYAVLIAAVAVVSVIYGAMLALAQDDLKRIVAYSSVSSMGYVILGLVAYTTYGFGGATFQMVAHGLISGLMFACVGVIYNVTHTRMVGDMSGLADRMPITTGAFVAGAFGYAGLPLMAGFAAEFFIFVGAFQSEVIPNDGMAVMTVLAMFGIVVVAGYLLWAMQRTLFGPFSFDGDYEVTKAARHDVVPLLTLIVLIVALGTFPNDIFFDMIQDAINPVIDMGDVVLDYGGGV